ncbi:MAG: SpoIVB peptidase [Thermoactinomyces sp.]
MQRQGKQKWFGFLLVLLLIMGSTTNAFQQFTQFPQEIRLFQGEWKQLHLSIPATADVSDPGILHIDGSDQTQNLKNLRHSFTLFTKTAGKTWLTVKLFGTLPIKKVQIQVYPRLKVIPGGQSIGVKLHSKGVIVVGHHRVQTGGYKVKSPAETADIRVGDYLIELNGQAVRRVQDVSNIVEKSGTKPIRVTLLRDGKRKITTIQAVRDVKDHCYRLGLYIRDSAAGVGTLTFFDPKQHVYGALGHVVTDLDTGHPILVGDGKIVKSNVTSIQKGESGEPGEKRAIFFQENQVLGNIKQNTPFGIFGQMEKAPDNGKFDKPIPIALAEQVKEGPAKILTVVEGQKVEEYDIEIVHVIKQKYPATKGLIIRVTDPRLLKKTGGIVQGMSGSPIIQDGKLIGAVTHVFVNDPTSGYGTFIEWMLQDAGVIQSTAATNDRSRFFYSPILGTCLFKRTTALLFPVVVKGSIDKSKQWDKQHIDKHYYQGDHEIAVGD